MNAVREGEESNRRSRREVLKKNLKVLVQRAEAQIAPLHICEIWLFGSSLRLKTEPNDADLVIIFKPEKARDEAVQILSGYITKNDSTIEGRQELELLISNEETIKRVANLHTFLGLGVNEWLHYIRATGELRRYTKFQFDPKTITKRILTKGTQRIQVAEILSLDEKEKVFSNMLTENLALLWSEEEKDVDAHIDMIEANQFETTAKEAKNFLAQIQRRKLQYQVFIASAKWAVAKILDGKKLTNEDELLARIYEVAVDQGLDDVFAKWLVENFRWSDRFLSEPPAQANATVNVEQVDSLVRNNNSIELSELCESLRVEIAKMKSKIPFLFELLSRLCSEDLFFINPKQFSEGTRISEEQEIVLRAMRDALQYTPLYLTSEELKRQVLIDVGLEDLSKHIVMDRRYHEKIYYSIERTEKEIDEAKWVAKENEVAREVEKPIRPVVKKSLPEHKFDVFVNVETKNEKIIPTVVRVHGWLRSSEEVDRQRPKLLALGFKLTHYEALYDTAELNIDVTEADGDTAKIAEIVARRLGQGR